MTSWVVADSGVYLTIALKEDLAPQASALITRWEETGTAIAAPYLFRYELVAVIRKHIVRANIELEQGQRAVSSLLTLPVTYFTDEALLGRAFELANALNRPTTYDSLYLALAEQLDCEFWTADRRLFNAVSAKIPNIRYLGDYSVGDE